VSDPYADAADLYWQAGWRGILPPALDHLVLVVVSGVVTQAHEFGFNES